MTTNILWAIAIVAFGYATVETVRGFIRAGRGREDADGFHNEGRE